LADRMLKTSAMIPPYDLKRGPKGLPQDCN
jgi:hypothetical protein